MRNTRIQSSGTAGWKPLLSSYPKVDFLDALVMEAGGTRRGPREFLETFLQRLTALKVSS